MYVMSVCLSVYLPTYLPTLFLFCKLLLDHHTDGNGASIHKAVSSSQPTILLISGYQTVKHCVGIIWLVYALIWKAMAAFRSASAKLADADLKAYMAFHILRRNSTCK